MSILLFLIILVVLIVSHEFGHFVVAKLFGIRVDEFAVGFPPRLWGVKKGETEYSLNALPFGGYVKIFGENLDDPLLHDHEKRKRSLIHKPKLVQAAVISAGVAFNLLLAWVLISFGFAVGFPTAVSGSGYEAYAKDTALTITSVGPGTPAEAAGLKPGDRILSLSSDADTLSPKAPEEMQNFIFGHGGAPIEIRYKRGQIEQTMEIVPREGIVPGKKAIGVSMDLVGTVTLPFYKAIWEGAKNTYFLTEGTVAGLWGLVKSTLVGQGNLSALTGPVGIVKLVGDMSALGPVYLLGFTALISINLAVINLIPVPALDGGRLLFVLIEWLKGSPINPRAARVVNAVGFALLIMLMVVVTYHDIARLIAS